jgi:PhnB protein
MPDRALIEQLDQAIEALLAGTPTPAADSELSALAEIASTLRDLPEESFKARLGTELERRASMPISTTTGTTGTTSHTVTPFISVPEGARLIEFMKRTFDAEELARHPHRPGGGFVASVRILDTNILIMEDESTRGREQLVALHVYVPDCDATYQRALDAGAKSMGEPKDQVYGERAGFVQDPAGNQWYIATHLGPTPALPSLWAVTPFVHHSNVPKYIEFLERAMGAVQLVLHEHGGRVVYAAVRIGDAVLEMGERETSLKSSFYLYVDDVDAAYDRALTAGATSIVPPADQPFGDRIAVLQDPFGFQWIAAKHLTDE